MTNRRKRHLNKMWRRAYNANVLGRKPREHGETAYVYVFSLGIENLYKIGFSRNCVQRLNSLRASNPNITEIIVCRVSEAWEHEQKLHQHFIKKKMEREIYRLSAADVEYIRLYLLGKQEKDRLPEEGQ